MLNYRLGERIGQDELATLYRATHLTLDRPVQIAVLRRSDWISVSRFQMAMRLGARLSHTNIMPVIDAGHDDQYGDYMVMPRLETRSLAETLADGALPPVQALRIITQVGAALEYLHGHQISHRDVQPANIHITPQGNALLANFSLAASPDTPDFSGIQEADVRTLYSAPELHLTSNVVAPAEDIYSLGAVGLHMLSGELPPAPGQPLPALADRNPALANADRVLARMLAPEPAQRYQSIPQAVAALNQALRELRDEATDDMQESRWEASAEWLDNPLELAVGDTIDQEFVARSRARADSLHRVDAVRRLLERWSRRGFMRRQHIGQLIEPEQIVSYNVYTYSLRAHYERRSEPQVRHVVYTGVPIETFPQETQLWDVPVPEYEPFADAAPEQIPVPGSRRLVPCPACNGAKTLPSKSCNGTGAVTRTRRVTDSEGKSRNEPFQENCAACHGYGSRECQRCDGHGQILEEKSFTWSRFGMIHRNEDDISGLHRLTVEAIAQPVFEGRIDPYDGRWYQVAPLKELLDEAMQAGGGDARLLAAELTIRGVPVTEIDYRYREKPHTLALMGLENAVRGDSSLLDIERLVLYAVIAALAIALVVFVLMWLL
jgi:serine/threonine protein kinase